MYLGFGLNLWGFLLFFNPALAIMIFSIIVLIIINICYKYLINQEEAAELKKKTKELRNEMKRYQKEGNREKVNELMGELMTQNNKLMKMTLKPMMVSLIIIIIFLPGLGYMYTNEKIELQDNMNVTIDNRVYEITINDSIIRINHMNNITECKMPCKHEIIGNSLWNIRYENNAIEFERITAVLPISFPLVGDDLGWFGWYVLVSIPFAFLIRKLLGIRV